MNQVCNIPEITLSRGSVRNSIDPWNVNQWKDWEFCQGTHRKLYSIDLNIPRKEVQFIHHIMKQINAETKNKKQFLLVDKQPITLEKKRDYHELTFYVYDTKSTITREYTVQYVYLNKEQNLIQIINGFRTRTIMEDAVLQSGYNMDNYNQLSRKYESYYMSLDKPHYYPMPLNPNPHSFSNVPSNLYFKTDKIPEKAGTFKAHLFNN